MLLDCEKCFPLPSPSLSPPSFVQPKVKEVDIDSALTPVISASAWTGVLLLIFFRKRLSKSVQEAMIVFLGGIVLLATLGIGIYLVGLMTS